MQPCACLRLAVLDSNSAASQASFPSRPLERKFAVLIVRLLIGSLMLMVPTRLGASLCTDLDNGPYQIIYICSASQIQEVERLALHRSNPSYGGYTSVVAPTESLTTCFGPGSAGIRELVVHALRAKLTRCVKG